MNERMKVVMLDTGDRIPPGLYQVTMIEESSVSNCCGIVLRPISFTQVPPHGTKAYLRGYEDAHAYFRSPVERREYKNPYAMTHDRYEWEQGWNRGFADFSWETHETEQPPAKSECRVRRATKAEGQTAVRDRISREAGDCDGQDVWWL